MHSSSRSFSPQPIAAHLKVDFDGAALMNEDFQLHVEVVNEHEASMNAVLEVVLLPGASVSGKLFWWLYLMKPQ